MTRKTHITVLRDEAVAALAIKPASTIVDATLGSLGHAESIIAKLGSKGTFIGIDADPTVAMDAQVRFKNAPCSVQLFTDNFSNIGSLLERVHIEKVDGILADLGWRMEQFGGNGKGFSFQVDEPLIMTYGDPSVYPFTARDILNEWDERDIGNVLKGYGEERYARRIARAVVETREQQPFSTTFELVSCIQGAVPALYRHGKVHPATRTFQALRIAVNDEFERLETFIKHGIERLGPQGRFAIITFHSLEDRIVKHLFRNYTHDQYGILVTKKPITASKEELARNPRARSAKLRIFERL